MLKFHQITVKNFLSYGNVPTTWRLDEHQKTLVVGKNGHGKSAVLLDGICFTLFGKPYRKITKTQIPNSINKKDCYLEIEFSTGGRLYKVVRGIKPNIFEIYEDGALIPEEASTGDYQEFLESNILKMNFRTFCQIAILGKAAYIPFMLLDAAKRREVVDDILSTGVYTLMNKVLKEREKATKQALTTIDIKIDHIKQQTLSQKKVISVLESSNQDRIDEKEEQISSTTEQHELQQKKSAQIEQDIENLVEPEKPDTKRISQLSDMIAEKRAERSRHQKSIDKIDTLDICPTCQQSVSDDHKHSIVGDSKEQVQILASEIETLTSEKSMLDSTYELYTRYESKLKSLSSDLKASKDLEIQYLSQINKIRKEIDSLRTQTSDIDSEKAKLKTLAKEGVELVSKKAELLEEQGLQEACIPILKDSGAKAHVVKEYLPVLNKLINKYLTAFDFFVDFNLDETFEETIKSRGRDAFSYHSFSEGQKEKIDYSILLALRYLAAMKNSAKMNLLVLDEILDGSLDPASRDACLDLLCETAGDKNLFVISHTESNPNAYDAVIHVQLKGDFSEYRLVD